MLYKWLFLVTTICASSAEMKLLERDQLQQLLSDYFKKETKAVSICSSEVSNVEFAGFLKRWGASIPQINVTAKDIKRNKKALKTLSQSGVKIFTLKNGRDHLSLSHCFFEGQNVAISGLEALCHKKNGAKLFEVVVTDDDKTLRKLRDRIGELTKEIQ